MLGADQRETHARHVGEKVEALRAVARGLGKTDGLTLACNLGAMIEARSRDHGLDAYEALERVWSQFEPDRARWSKRLRYVRFSSERENRSTETAGAGADFVRLASAIAATLPIKSLAPEHDLIDVQTRLLRNTEFDPDPTIALSVDFDAARDLVELMDRAVEKIVEAVPELLQYFRRIEIHGLKHPESGVNPSHDPTVRPMQILDNYGWDTGTFEMPGARDMKWNMTVSPATMREGFLFYDDGLDALLPRIVLGRITYGFRVGTVSESDLAESTGSSLPVHPDTIIRTLRDKSEYLGALQAEPENVPEHGPVGLLTYEVQLVLVPSAAPQSPGVRAGIILRPPWETFYFEDHKPVTGEDDSYLGLVQLIDASGNRRFALDHYALRLATRRLPLLSGMFFDSLFLLPGDAADHVLGLRHTSPIEEISAGSMPFGISIEPNFDAPAEFTPQAATSLGGLLTRNLLYAGGQANVVERLIDDARTRSARLDAQYQQWMSGFAAARAAFLSSGGPESTS